MKQIILFIVMLFYGINLIAQDDTISQVIPKTDSIQNTKKTKTTSFKEGIFETATFGKPFWSDIRSSISKGEIAFAPNNPTYDWGKQGGKYKPYVFANLGIDAPFWTGNLGHSNKYSLTVTIPFYIHVWMDFFERSTAPVIDVDYNFGVPEFTFIHRLDKNFLGLKNYVIRLSPFKHECTHMGDELTIYRVKELDLQVNRVNVSYNYTEVGLTLNDPDGSLNQNHAVRLGFMLLNISYKTGFYNTFPQETNIDLTKLSKYKYEWFVQYQYQTNTDKKTNLQGVFSLEIRNRAKYNYPYYTKQNENGTWIEQGGGGERMTWNANAFVGVRYNNPKVTKYCRMGIGLHGYAGINPYGQFRNMDNFQQFGIALLIER